MTAATAIETPRERPILFSSAMVKAILAGTKHQTRRVVKEQPPTDGSYYADRYNKTERWAYWLADGRMDSPRTFGCPYGAPGDMLWAQHGTQNGYRRGCRCHQCKLANRNYRFSMRPHAEIGPDGRKIRTCAACRQPGHDRRNCTAAQRPLSGRRKGA